MKHNLSKTRLYSIFSGMKQRCYNPNSPDYKWYGGKGITICDEWLRDNGLQNFIEWSLDNGYNETLTIDRIDSNKGYSPDNCQWISQSLNSQRAHITFPEGGVVMAASKIIKQLMIERNMSVKELAEKLEIAPQSMSNKLYRDSFSFDEVLKITNILDCDIQFITRDTKKIFQ